MLRAILGALKEGSTDHYVAVGLAMTGERPGSKGGFTVLISTDSKGEIQLTFNSQRPEDAVGCGTKSLQKIINELSPPGILQRLFARK